MEAYCNKCGGYMMETGDNPRGLLTELICVDCGFVINKIKMKNKSH